jgi:mono/diheme cytochrome c family protein
MNRWMKRSLIGLLALASLVAVTVSTGLVLEQRRLARSIDVPVRPVAVPTDAAALVRGRYLYTSRGCADCHGAAGAGHRLVDSGSVTIAGPDITRGGSTRRYEPEDWVRAVRHGLAPGGRPLRVMPSEDYNRLTDTDLGALVAYVASLPPGGGAPAVVKLPLPARVLYGFGLVDAAVDRIDHRRPPEEPVPEAVTLAHGRYVAQGCVGCHGQTLGGGRIPGAPPDWPAAPALLTGDAGVMGRYTDAQAFAAMMKGGRRPDGTAIAVMPFESLSKLNDVDMQALHLYLRQGARPLPAGHRQEHAGGG